MAAQARHGRQTKTSNIQPRTLNLEGMDPEPFFRPQPLYVSRRYFFSKIKKCAD
jgi:hypothetical protein